MPVADFSEVRPGKVYVTADVATLNNVDEETVLRWIKNKKLNTLPRVGSRGPHRILGAEILRLLGEQAALLKPVETPREREARAAGELERLRRNAKHRPARVSGAKE